MDNGSSSSGTMANKPPQLNKKTSAQLPERVKTPKPEKSSPELSFKLSNSQTKKGQQGNTSLPNFKRAGLDDTKQLASRNSRSQKPASAPLSNQSQEKTTKTKAKSQKPLVKGKKPTNKNARQGSSVKGLKKSKYLKKTTHGKPLPPAKEAKKPPSIHARRQKKHQEIAFKRLQHLAKFGTFIALIGGLLWVFQHWVLNGSIHQPPAVVIAQPMGLTTPSDISKTLAKALNTNSAHLPIEQLDTAANHWLVRPTQPLKQSLKTALPFAEDISITRRLFPNRWVVGIAEQYPWAVLKYQPTNLPDKAEPSPPLKTQPVAIGVLVETSQPTSLIALSKDARKKFNQYTQQPSAPLTTILVDSTNTNTLDTVEWEKIKLLADWLHTLAAWPNVTIDTRYADNIILRSATTPPVQLGALDSQWTKRFQRLGPLLPYARQWQDKVSSIDLRWPTQIILHAKGDLSKLSTKAREQFNSDLATLPVNTLSIKE